MEYLIMAGQLILSLSILIVLHEMGHFFPARWFNTRVEKFYLFFDPGFELFKYKHGETEYGIGWLPLGGYVKIAGMIDESMDKEQLAKPPQPWEFRSKPAWQRLIIMLGGVTVNFILGFLIYAMVLFVWGKEYLPTQNAAYGIHTDSLGMKLGLQNGDQVLAVGDVPFERFNYGSIVRSIVIDEANTIKIRRNGSEKILSVTQDHLDLLTKRENSKKALFVPRVPFVVNKIPKADESPAEKAGMAVGDSIIAVNGNPVRFFDEVIGYTRQNKGKEITLTLIREGSTIDKTLTLTEEGRMGILAMPYDHFFETERQDYGFGESFPAGFKEGSRILSDNVKAIGSMFTGRLKASESLGGFGTIAGLFGGEWIWERFWRMTAVLSLILGFMNLLPIPALDGGYVMFLLYEVVSGRKPGDKFMEYATITGFVLVLGLLLYANGIEIINAIKGAF